MPRTLVLNFPSYELLKSLPLKRQFQKKTRQGDTINVSEHLEYSFTLFKTPTSVYGRITYNEDDQGMLIFDVMEDGYCGHNKLGKCLKFNKKNYNAIRAHAQSIYNSFFNTLETDMSWQWEDKTIDQIIDTYAE